MNRIQVSDFAVECRLPDRTMHPPSLAKATKASLHGPGTALKSEKAKISGPTSGLKPSPFLTMHKVTGSADKNSDSSGKITQLLKAAQQGDSVENDLLPLVYDHMRRLARSFMVSQNAGHSMQPTDLVHEAYLKLVRKEDASWQNRRHFMAVAGRAMRCILVDHARSKGRMKRKAGEKREPLDHIVQGYEDRSIDILALNESLEKLSQQDPRLVQIVELRFFSGFPAKEIAEILNLSTRTVERDWKVAKRLLRKWIDEV
jgi:RNA polymerase sigma factor (TIGR02999 family)